MIRIALLVQDRDISTILELRLQSKGYQAVTLNDPSSALGFLYSDPPNLVLADLSMPNKEEVITIIKQIKDDSYFSMLPVIGILPESMLDSEELAQYPLDDFVSHPLRYLELFSRITLASRRIRRILDNNPLSRLPGNTSIQRAIENALGKPMAVCYLDINNFKAYNDTYGFARGDEVIRMVARINTNAIKECCDTGFSGHIGGDDFVFIVPLDRADSVCRTVLDNFDLIVSDLFDEEEKAAGYYVAKNRKGEKEKIPLLGVAIAVVPTTGDHIKHPGMVAEIASELKKLAKRSPESTFVIDRRGKNKVAASKVKSGR